MTTQQEKVIKSKLGPLELANVLQACQIMGYSRKTLVPYAACLAAFFVATRQSC